MAAATVYTLNLENISEEQKRLEENHWNLWLPLTASLLPTDIRDYLSTLDAPRIADVGTGTGVWLASIATELPVAATLHGYDFDTSKFRGKEALPPNVELRQANALEPFPEELQGQYDLVHVRLFAFALKQGQWESTAARLATLLKPGGWLYWEDTIMATWTNVPIGPAWAKVLRTTMLYASEVAGADITAPSRMKKAFEDIGLQDTTERFFQTFTKDLQAASDHCLFTGTKQYCKGAARSGRIEDLKTDAEVDELFTQAQAEMEAGHRCGFTYCWFWGRKPVKTNTT
ncbi:S-adenosyl-L-methionine-dependent methyltransferase [Xylariales sp. PMI_506]|nr:S-adenosyl-L-methionine-dependent methyltransferase [Xylariales sp. PMI_506]